MPKHTLFFSPGACSLSIAIALNEAGIPYDRERVNLRTKTLDDGRDYRTIVPKGYVPALRLPDGAVLTEAAVAMQYVADQAPDKQLMPAATTFERYRALEWLNFIATELHKGTGVFFNPAANDELKAATVERLGDRWSVLAAALRTQPYLMGERFTVADGYAFYPMRVWQKSVKQDLARWPELVDYYARLAARPSIMRALEDEGLSA